MELRVMRYGAKVEAAIISISVNEAVGSDFGDKERAVVGGEEDRNGAPAAIVPLAGVATTASAVGVGKEGDGEKEYA